MAGSKKKNSVKIIHAFIYFFAVIGVISTVGATIKGINVLISVKKIITQAPLIDEEILTVNEYSRPAIPLSEVDGIVIHYTANPGTSADNNRSYFEGLKDSHLTHASSHYIIGLEGEIIQCIPLSEQAYASNERNVDTISIECCHPDETGRFNDATYDNLVYLCAWLMGQYDLETDDLLRHYDISQKNCPKYFVDHPDEWETFKADVEKYIEENGERVRDVPGDN